MNAWNPSILEAGAGRKFEASQSYKVGFYFNKTNQINEILKRKKVKKNNVQIKQYPPFPSD